MSKILFILWESWSGKTSLEKHLVEHYWFRMFDKLSSRPPRNDDSGYMHFPAREISDMYVDWLVHECVKYDNNFYAMRLPSDAKPDDCFVVCIVPQGYHQFIDMWIEDNHEVESIFLTNDNAEEWMRKRWDNEADIARRVTLNKRLRRYAWWHEQIDGSRWLDCLVELLKLIYPTFIWAKRDSKHSS